ncbi:MAG: LCP family protein [Armatimonadetes bacterium]|nr:LCP family protein [Armatimonadota bacterium]
MEHAVEPVKWKKVVKTTAYVLLLTGVLLAGATIGWLNSGKVTAKLLAKTFTFNPKAPAESFRGENGPLDHLTVLILGCDEDLTTGGLKVTNAKARSDMMLVARLDFANNAITALSVPRDLEFNLPSYDKKVHKMNAFHAYGGDQLTEQAIEALLGIKIDRTTTLNFEAFQDIVDLLGGVTVDVDKDMKYTDRAGNLFINLKKGKQKLNGYKAMGFVRFRHDDSDFARQERQKQFLIAMKSQALSKFWVMPGALDKAMALAGGEFNEDEFSSLLLFAKSVKPSDIKMGMVPVVEEDKAVKLDEDKLVTTLADYKFTAPLKASTTPVNNKKNPPKRTPGA